MRVLILGCGPSGLLAAHAANLQGIEPIIVSIKRPSMLFGCQYLHAAIPETKSGKISVRIEYQLIGSADDYAQKVYGPERPPTVSPQELTRSHLGWNIRDTYVELWDRYEGAVLDTTLTETDIPEMEEYYKPDLFVSSIPSFLMCTNTKHDFKSTKCWAIGDAPQLGQYAPKIAHANTVLCNGTKDTGWYRSSNVFGYNTVEWPGWRSKPPVAGVVQFFKPLSTDCDCWPHLRRIGRMGHWRKGVLAHDAFGETTEMIGAL